MLQIIGWLGCVYLLVKAFEILGNQSNRVKTWDQIEAEEKSAKGEDVKVPQPPFTRLSVWSLVGALCAFAGAIIFPFVLNSQAGQIAVSTQPAQTFSECLRSATTAEEISKCHPD